MKKKFENKPTPNYLNPVHRPPEEIPFDFDTLFDRFAPYVASIALRLLGNENAVEDLVQDVFLDCFQKLDTLQNMSHARRWLVKVTVRKASRKLRRKKIAQFLHLSDPSCPEPSLPLVTADERAELVMIYQLLERMPVPLRIAWSLRYMEGARIAEIAYACNCSSATAKRRIREAQQIIRGETEHG